MRSSMAQAGDENIPALTLDDRARLGLRDLDVMAGRAYSPGCYANFQVELEYHAAL
jgi:hypothetical protein